MNLAKEVQKDRDQQWKLSQHLEALEAQEQDRELRIALQEDRIQELQREVDELQGKICRCHEQAVPSTLPVEEEDGWSTPLSIPTLLRLPLPWNSKTSLRKTRYNSRVRLRSSLWSGSVVERG